MAPEQQNNFGNNHQAHRKFPMLEPLQRFLEARLASYSRQPIDLPGTLQGIPMLTGSGEGIPRLFPSLVNKISDLLEYLIGDRFTVSQLTGYQGELVFLLPFRGLHSSVFNINVDASFSVNEKIFLRYFRLWQQQAPKLNMVTRIQQTGSLSYALPSVDVNEIRTEDLLPQSWQTQPGISPLDYAYRKTPTQNLSDIYSTLQQFEYIRLDKNITARDMNTTRWSTQWASDQPPDMAFVFAPGADPAARPHELSGAVGIRDDSPYAAPGSFVRYEQSGRRRSPTRTQNPARFAGYIENRNSTAFTSLLHEPQAEHFLPATWSYFTHHPAITLTEYSEPALAESSPDAESMQSKQTGFLRDQYPNYTTSPGTDYSFAVARPQAVRPNADATQSGVSRGEHPAVASLWPSMILNVQHWLHLIEQSQEMSITEKSADGNPVVPLGLYRLNRSEEREFSADNRAVYPSMGFYENKFRRAVRQIDAEESLLRDFTFIRAAEQVHRQHQNYTFARPLNPALKENPASQHLQQKEVVSLVRKEVETALKAQSPMENLTRVELTRLADQLYSTLVRRLVIEKERLSG